MCICCLTSIFGRTYRHLDEPTDIWTHLQTFGGTVTERVRSYAGAHFQSLLVSSHVSKNGSHEPSCQLPIGCVKYCLKIAALDKD